MKFEYETDRLILKVLSSQDAGDVCSFYSRNREYFIPFEPSRNANYYTPRFQASILDAEQKLFFRLSSVRYYIFDKNDENQDIIGTISLTGIKGAPECSARTGYRMDKAFTGKGYAYEAMSCLLSNAFEKLPLQRIEAHILPENERSIALVNRLGFTHEGTARNFCEINGVRRDHNVYSLLKGELIPYLTE